MSDFNDQYEMHKRRLTDYKAQRQKHERQVLPEWTHLDLSSDAGRSDRILEALGRDAIGHLALLDFGRFVVVGLTQDDEIGK